MISYSELRGRSSKILISVHKIQVDLTIYRYHITYKIFKMKRILMGWCGKLFGIWARYPEWVFTVQRFTPSANWVILEMIWAIKMSFNTSCSYRDIYASSLHSLLWVIALSIQRNNCFNLSIAPFGSDVEMLLVCALRRLSLLWTEKFDALRLIKQFPNMNNGCVL